MLFGGNTFAQLYDPEALKVQISEETVGAITVDINKADEEFQVITIIDDGIGREKAVLDTWINIRNPRLKLVS